MFHLFMGYAYYPDGGMDDYIKSFPTVEEAKERASLFVVRENGPGDRPWAHIARVNESGELETVWTLRDDRRTNQIEEWSAASV
jgi:hypothetical protein